MESLMKSLPWLVAGLIGVVALAALGRPLKWLFTLAARTGVGLGVLYALRYVGGLVGINLGVNLVNALVLGLLGVPGLGLLLMANWVLAA